MILLLLFSSLMPQFLFYATWVKARTELLAQTSINQVEIPFLKTFTFSEWLFLVSAIWRLLLSTKLIRSLCLNVAYHSTKLCLLENMIINIKCKCFLVHGCRLDC